MATKSGRSTTSSRSSLSSQNSLDKPVPVVSPIKTLRQLVVNNIEHYQRVKGSYGERFYAAFCMIDQEVDAVQPALESLEQIAPEFDFSPEVPGNGYRSLAKVVDSCIDRLVQISRYISINRDGLLFRSGHYCKEIEAFAKVSLCSTSVHELCIATSQPQHPICHGHNSLTNQSSRFTQPHAKDWVSDRILG